MWSTSPGTLDRSQFQMGLPDRAGRVRAGQRPPADLDDPDRSDRPGLQLSPDGTRLVYLLERTAGGDLRLHLLPLAGTSSVTDGHDLLVAGDCPASMYHQRPDPGSTIISITKVVLTELPSP